MPSSSTEHCTSDPASGRPSKQASQETAECPGAVQAQPGSSRVRSCRLVLGLPLPKERGAGASPVQSADPLFVSTTLGFALFSQECSSDNELKGMLALHQSVPVTVDLYHAAGKGRRTTGATPREP